MKQADKSRHAGTVAAAVPQQRKWGVAGRIAAAFQNARITPLLALIMLLLGVFAVLVTPREEEPQIDVTMVNVSVPFPGARVQDVEQMVSIPAEQVLSQMRGVEHVMSVSHPGMAVITVQFAVGVPRHTALVRLYDVMSSHADWLPRDLGVMQPVISPRGIDDVPIVSVTLHAAGSDMSSNDLRAVAASMEADLKRVQGTRGVQVIGGSNRQIRVEIDPQRMAAQSVGLQQLAQVLQSANTGMPVGALLQGNTTAVLRAGAFIDSAQEMEELVVGAHQGRPVYLRDVATVRDGFPAPESYVWHGTGAAASATVQAATDLEQAGKSSTTGCRSEACPAVTLAITKKAGENATDVAAAVIQRVQLLRNTVIPEGVESVITRNYGETASDKATQLMQKLLFATASVVLLILFALGRREAAVIGAAVLTTLTITLFASWAWGFTLNRVSLFALIFSIGILVDDAIVVVENIHRHMLLHPERKLLQLIPDAVDEVGSPTILATFTVIAALLPMAFVSGLMGPYMSPIPINASMGMLLSLAIAFVLTPWLARIWLKRPAADADSLHADETAPDGQKGLLHRLLHTTFRPFLAEKNGARNRLLLALVMVVLIVLAAMLPAAKLVVLKMLPFDNKSEIQVVVDMPVGTPLEKTAAVLRDLGEHLSQQPEVLHYQVYAGTAAPVNFNGLVRQYHMRRMGHQGDIQVNLADSSARSEQSHAIAMRLRPALQAIGKPYGANVKIVEVPPGPPVAAPIVAEVYGSSAAGREALAQQMLALFEQTPGVTDVDTSVAASTGEVQLTVDRARAAALGISQAHIVQTLRTAAAGQTVSYLRNAAKYPVPVVLSLPESDTGSLDALLQLKIPTATGGSVSLREVVSVTRTAQSQPVYRKNMLPVSYVTGDMASQLNRDNKLEGLDSPLYGMFAMRSALHGMTAPDGEPVQEYFISQPEDAWRGYAVKWDGEWQITYETFRDMGLAYAVGLILIYLLAVAQFGSYTTPLVIMAPIPLTLIGVMPGHALLGAQFTATSMIGMIALAGIIVRNSILLVDFINLQLRQGMPFAQAVVQAAITRARPIGLTALAAMTGAFFILDDPIFNGLAVSLIFGILVSTVLTLLVIPVLYYALYHRQTDRLLRDE